MVIDLTEIKTWYRIDSDELRNATQKPTGDHNSPLMEPQRQIIFKRRVTGHRLKPR